jgi:hypothetical protein
MGENDFAATKFSAPQHSLKPAYFPACRSSDAGFVREFECSVRHVGPMVRHSQRSMAGGIDPSQARFEACRPPAGEIEQKNRLELA